MPYTAVLRWKGPDPALELETRHQGFQNPEDAVSVQMVPSGKSLSDKGPRINGKIH